MKNLQAEARKVEDMLISNGFYYPNKIYYRPMRSVGRVWGRAKKEYGTSVVEINPTLLLDNANERGLQTVLIHEILHHISGIGEGHRGKWLMLAHQVKQKMGFDITRTNSDSELGFNEDNNTDRLNISRYAVKCTKCGKLITRNRMSNIIQLPSFYTCICGGKLIRIK